MSKEKTLKYLKEPFKDDSAASTMITSMLFLPIMFFILISIIDFAMFSMTNSEVTKIARDGANTIATLGSRGSLSYYAINEPDYPQRLTQNDILNARSEYGIYFRNAVEVFVAQDIMASSSTYELKLDSVLCYVDNDRHDPENVKAGEHVFRLGQRPVCEVTWRYDGLPFSGWGMVQSRENGRIVPQITQGFSTADFVTNHDFRSQRHPRPVS